MLVRKAGQCLVVQAVVSLLVISCTGTGESEGASSSPDTGHQGDVIEELGWSALPVQGLVYRTPIDVVINAAQSSLDQARTAQLDCMASKGFPDVSLENGSGSSYVLGSLVRPVDDEDAQARGLNLASWLEARAKDPLPQSTAQYDSKAALESVDQCIDQADLDTSMNSLVDSYRSEVLQSATVRAAVEQWSACMADRGYAVANVRELADTVLPTADVQLLLTKSTSELTAWAAEFLPKEREAGAAVVACDIVALFPAIEGWTAAEEAWSASHASELRELSSDERLMLSMQIAL